LAAGEVVSSLAPSPAYAWERVGERGLETPHRGSKAVTHERALNALSPALSHEYMGEGEEASCPRP
jgi:hypothetical protein